MMLHIGILALQGNFLQHAEVLSSLSQHSISNNAPHDIRIHLIKQYSDIAETTLDGIILPGGESSTMLTLLHTQDMREILISRIQEGMPVLATCAGAILLSHYEDEEKGYQACKLSHIQIERNAYGRQVHSFIAELNFSPPPFNTTVTNHVTTQHHTRNQLRALFIRAPKITSYSQEDVHVLSSYEQHAVIVQEGNMLIATCHPESVPDTLLHEHFIHLAISLL